MYEEEYNKNIQLQNENKHLKLENINLKNEIKKLQNAFESKKEDLIRKIKKPLMEENQKLKEELSKAFKEIDRLKDCINKNNDEKKDYEIERLTNQLNKNSTNSGIPTSKESISENVKRRTNEYNHRTKTGKKSGGQLNHPGKTLTKEKVKEMINSGEVPVKIIENYVDGNKYKKEIIKYKIGIKTQAYVEKYVFIPNNESKEVLPKEFYSGVSYKDDIKSFVVLLGNYFSMPYNKITECIRNLTSNMVSLSEGTIDNIYEEFSNKTGDTLENIKTNLLNGNYQHTDETVTKENGKDSYYRGYANLENVLFKYHNLKGDAPIEEDDILTIYLGIVIADHEVGIFKYGTHNQDCIVHFGRYCLEQHQNIVTVWQMEIYRLLLKLNKEREILKKFGRNSFTEDEIKIIYDDYDSIIELAKEENEYIPSKYWKEKANTLLKRSIKYKEQLLYFIHDFNIPSDNNFMERVLRMIKSKTKVSGGFRSSNGGIRFGNIMSVVKTSKLRGKVPFESITEIMKGNSLFA